MTKTSAEPNRIVFVAVRGLALTGAMLLAGSIDLSIRKTTVGVIPLWLPGGVTLGGLFLLGRAAVPFLWLGAFLISAAVRPVPLAVVLATGDLLSAWLGWWLLTRVPEFNKELRRAQDVLAFLLYGAIVSPMAGAFIGVASQAAFGALPWRATPGVYLTWWLGNVSGVLVSAPLFLRWNGAWWSRLRREGRAREASAAYGLVGLLILLLVFIPPANWGTMDALWKVLPWPFLVWAALRFGTFGAPSAMFLLAVGNIVEFLRLLHGGGGDPQRLLWDQWATTMALSTAGLVVMALEADRTRADEDKDRLQMQLFQAQKMECIGRLAGGIAHDFNNLLTVINGQSALVLRKLAVGDPLRRKLLQILEAGERAAALTRQVLVFSRQQMLDVQVVDLNVVVEGMRSMLDHLMGDNVEVCFDLDAKAVPVLADAHQLEQVILNLAVNARDAMPSGGRLQIGTAVSEWGEREAAMHAGGHPGPYAGLVVKDNGAGIDEETRPHVFEPFFTTKPPGTGTGLGLSIVRGIVAQSRGYVDLDSKPGHGATFRVYLPLQSDEKLYREERAAAPVPYGRGTVLVVDDRCDVRQYVSEVLRTYNYKVLEAAGVDDAVRLSERISVHFDLVLSDVVMPGMSGVDLVAKLATTRPGIKALFMSGHSDPNAAQTAAPNGANFLQKPFSPEVLVERVRSVLALQAR